MKKFLSLVLVLAMIVIANVTPAFADSNLVLLSNEGCVGWDVNETGDLRPGYICIGDVEVNGVVKYDEGGIGEDTIVINLSGEDVSIYAEYGAGEEAIDGNNVDLDELKSQLALQEFSRKEENKSGQEVYSFTSLRFVVIDKDGNILKDDFVKRGDFFAK